MSSVSSNNSKNSDSQSVISNLSQRIINSDLDIPIEKPILKYDPDCIRKRSNWSSQKNEFKMDHPSFEPAFFLKDMPAFSPKLVALLKKIEELDVRDIKKHGTTFKHFIFSDIKSGGQGAKMLASGLISTGWNLGYTSELKNREKFVKKDSKKKEKDDEESKEEDEEDEHEDKQQEGGGSSKSKPQWGPIELIPPSELKKTKKNFYLLSSVSVFDKPISVRIKKEILANFNSRPDNIYGDLARIIVMDSGFKEGIDLFDIKYIHIFEPSMNTADQKQVIGRGTRTCGQKGLEFHPTRGWPLEVFVYDMEIPEKLRFSMLGAETTQELLMRAMNADIRLANFGYDIERLAVLGSVDYELNENVHNFEIDLSDEDADEVVLGGSSISSSSISSSVSDSHSYKSSKFDPEDFEEDMEVVSHGLLPLGHKEMSKYIRKNFWDYRWDKVKMENLCGELPDEWRRKKSRMSSISELSPLSDIDDIHDSSRRTTRKSRVSSSKRSSRKSSISRMSDSISKKDEDENEHENEDENEDEDLVYKPGSPAHSIRGRPVSEGDSVNESPTSSIVESTISEDSESSDKKYNPNTQPKMGGASEVLAFTPTQAFIQHYFTPFTPIKGLLLYHSVGTGKTCSAIAAASTNFEPYGYTILWVTRTTLKNDIWKNMFDQICNKSIQDRLARGESIPDTQQERMRLLSKAWRIRPMSYKQFSNLVSKKNQYYQQLVKENGEADPLRKTLLIIDEAHKLYGGGDLSSLERPDMAAFHEALMNSYTVSGFDSVKILLMTATPITENPMELIRLINLCKPIQAQMPDTFEGFAQDYLNSDGGFTSTGRERFLNDIAGHISYLNREKDARQFSQPRVKKVMVPIIEDIQAVEDFDKYVSRSEAEDNILKIQENLEKVVREMENELTVLTKKHFEAIFYESCSEHTDLSAKQCKTVINKNIVDLMKEIKGYINTVKKQIADIKRELLELKKGKQRKLVLINRKIKENPMLFNTYKLSTYASIRTNCSSKTLSGTQFMEAINGLPEIVEINQEIQANKDAIMALERQMVVEIQGFKMRIKQMKESLKDKNIAPVQRMEIELSVRDSQKDFRKTKKEISGNIQDQIKEEKEKIKKAEKSKQEIYKTVRKTLKKRASLKKKQEKAARKEEKKLKKTETLLMENIKNIDVKEIVERRKVLINRDLMDFEEELQEKAREKIRKQEEREHDKRIKKTLKERERAEARERKNLEKQRAKEEAKAVKKNITKKKY
jgi:hypothetical protein